MNTTSQSELKKEKRLLLKEMKARGVRKVSCFNGGLTPLESYYNTELFRLNSLIKK